MAVAIGTGTGEIQTASGNPVTSITISKPTNASSGDLLIMVVAAASTPGTISCSGWTQIQTIVQSLGAHRMTAFYRTHDGSASYTPSWSASVSAVGMIARVTGGNPSAPVDVSGTTDGVTDFSTTHLAPSVTTTVADTLLINCYMANAGGVNYTPASSQTELCDVNIGTGVTMEATKLAVAGTGATGAKQSTCSSSNYWASMSFALAPYVATTSIKSVGGVAQASIKSVAGVPIASVKSVAGVT